MKGSTKFWTAIYIWLYIIQTCIVWFYAIPCLKTLNSDDIKQPIYAMFVAAWGIFTFINGAYYLMFPSKAINDWLDKNFE